MVKDVEIRCLHSIDRPVPVALIVGMAKNEPGQDATHYYQGYEKTLL